MRRLRKVKCGKLDQVMLLSVKLCLWQKILASSWQKATIHGSKRTPHGGKRHVMWDTDFGELHSARAFDRAHTEVSCRRQSSRDPHTSALSFFLTPEH